MKEKTLHEVSGTILETECSVMTLGQTTMWLCCKLMLCFQRLSLCDSPWPARVINYAAKVSGLCQIWGSLSWRLQLKVSKLLSLWNGVSHRKVSGVVSSLLAPSLFCLGSEVSLREDLQVKSWNTGCKSKQERWYFFRPCIHISYMKALTDRQRCLVALRYDDSAVDVSTDTVTHTLRQQWSHLEKPTCGSKDVHTHSHTHTVWLSSFQILTYNCHTCFRQGCGN